jgi:hypothetical protein
VELEVVPCFVSRLSTACASLSDVSVPHLEDLLEGNSGLTLHSILEILGILKEAELCLSRELLFKPLTTPESIRGVLKLLSKQGPLRDLVEVSRKQRHQLAFGYLDALTRGHSVIGVVDLGWSGSIQRNISRILRLGGRQVRTVGCYLANTPRAADLFLDGDEAHACFGSGWKGSTILPEIAITACIGSTQGYRRTPAGDVLPVLGRFEIAPEEKQIKQRLREGVLAYQYLWNHVRATRRPGAFTADIEADLDQELPSILLRLLDHPLPDEAWRLGRLNHDENYWGERFSRPLCASDGGERLRREGIQGLYVKPDSYWPQGVVARHHPRLVSALARRWQDGVALGRIGAQPVGVDAQSGENDDELSSLRELLTRFAPGQVVYVGHNPRPLQQLLAQLADDTGWLPPPAEEKPMSLVRKCQRLTEANHELWTDRGEIGTRLIVLGAAPGLSLQVSPMTHVVAGRLAEVETLRSVRNRLRECVRIALVLSDELESAARGAIVNGLAPFLGPEGLILAAHGRAYHALLETEHPATRQLTAWVEQEGADLGYEPWDASDQARLHLVNWYVLVRGQSFREAAGYWSCTLSELPLLDPSPGEPSLLISSAAPA